MKRFLKKRWLGLPVGIITIVLLVCLLGGTALAINGYTFFSGSVNAEVREAIAMGVFDTWDNLKPYGSDAEAVWEWEQDSWHTGELGDITITLGEEPTITIVGIEGYQGAGFVAGEWVVIPINLRNGSSVELTLGAYAEAVGLDLECCWLTNTGNVTETHPDGDLNYAFKDDGSWVDINAWTTTIAGKGGESGSARIGAEVLFVKIAVPEDADPAGTYTATFSLARGVTP